MKINPSDTGWLKENYPGLRVKDQGTIIIGILRFRARKIAPGKIFIYDKIPCEKEIGKPCFIEDKYEVEISFNGHNPYPCVKEIGKRLEARAEKMGMREIDLHIFSDTGKLCLGSPPKIIAQMRKKPVIKGFFENLLIPYFYYHSYWEKFGSEPWSGLPHGAIGILEDLPSYKNELDDPEILEATLGCLAMPDSFWSGGRIKPNDRCLCGSRKKIKRCHPNAIEGFNTLRRAYRREYVQPLSTI